MKKWNLVFDAARCTGCHNCVVATQDEYQGNSFPGYAAQMPPHTRPWVAIERKERGQYPVIDVSYLFHACQHCDEPACVRAARDGAAFKRPDGIVIIDPVKARGQKQIADACPYGAVVWNESSQLPQHWNFDAHLIDAGWTQPRAAQACPTGALVAHHLSDDEMRQVVARDGLRSLHPEFNARPRIHYRHLERFDSAFVAGSLVETVSGVEECAGDVPVQLWCQGRQIAQSASDTFGDFLFDGLQTTSRYTLELGREGNVTRKLEFILGDSRHLGTIRLDDAHEPRPAHPAAQP